MTWMPSLAGGDSPTTIDSTPTVSYTYDGSSGVLVSTPSGGSYEGWKVNAWASFNSISEDSSGYLELNVNIPGQMYIHYQGDYLRNGPYIYKDCTGDFELYAHQVYGGGDNQAVSGLIAGRLGDGVTYDSFIASSFGSWNGADGKFYGRVCRFGASSTEYTGGLNGSWNRWTKIKRAGDQITISESADGSSWTDRIGPVAKDYAGSKFRLGIAAGGNTGATNALRFNRVVGTFYEAS